MARSLICGLGTLEPQPLDEGGMSVEDDPDLSAPFDVSSVHSGHLSQRMAADEDDDPSNQATSSQVGMKKSRGLSQMLADEEAAGKAAYRGK